MRVLLVEDDQRLAEATQEYLQRHGAEVVVVGDGVAALERALAGGWDVILLDLMLPGLDGLEICRRVRALHSTPIIVASARGDDVDRVVGLEMGADDYVAKPFNPRELLARIKAVLRRAGPTAAPRKQLSVGRISIDRDRREATLDGQAIEVTAYPFEVLWALLERHGHVISRAQLHARIRELRDEPPSEFDPAVDRAVDMHVSKLRQALTQVSAEATAWIKTLRGVGYQLNVPSA